MISSHIEPVILVALDGEFFRADEEDVIGNLLHAKSSVFYHLLMGDTICIPFPHFFGNYAFCSIFYDFWNARPKAREINYKSILRNWSPFACIIDSESEDLLHYVIRTLNRPGFYSNFLSAPDLMPENIDKIHYDISVRILRDNNFSVISEYAHPIFTRNKFDISDTLEYLREIDCIRLPKSPRYLTRIDYLTSLEEDCLHLKKRGDDTSGYESCLTIMKEKMRGNPITSRSEFVSNFKRHFSPQWRRARWHTALKYSVNLAQITDINHLRVTSLLSQTEDSAESYFAVNIDDCNQKSKLSSSQDCATIGSVDWRVIWDLAADPEFRDSVSRVKNQKRINEVGRLSESYFRERERHTNYVAEKTALFDISYSKGRIHLLPKEIDKRPISDISAFFAGKISSAAMSTILGTKIIDLDTIEQLGIRIPIGVAIAEASTNFGQRIGRKIVDKNYPIISRGLASISHQIELNGMDAYHQLINKYESSIVEALRRMQNSDEYMMRKTQSGTYQADYLLDVY